MDLQGASRDPGSKGDSRSQHLMRFAAKHRGSRGRRVRRLYEGVVRSRSSRMDGDLMANGRSLLLLRSLQRKIAIRIVRGYRTISYASASVLAASPPYELQALALRRVYEHLRNLGLGRAYAVHRQPAGPGRPDGGESRDLGAMALSAARG